MALTRVAPNTIYLGGGGPGGEGGFTIINDMVMGVAATPGMQVETFKYDSELKWRPVASATEFAGAFILVENLMFNKGIDDICASGELAQVYALNRGAMFYGLIPSGEDISKGDLLQPNGDGKFKAATVTTADAGLGKFKAYDELGAVTEDTRCRIEVL